MTQHAQLEFDADIAVYFCDPHSPWQRPSNENTMMFFACTPGRHRLTRWEAADL